MSRVITLVLFALCSVLAISTVVMAQAPVAAATVAADAHIPTVADAQKLKVQLLYTQRELAVSQYNELKMSYDKQSSDLNTKFQNLQQELQALVDVLYQTNNVTKEAMDFDLSKGEFVPRQAPAPPAVGAAAPQPAK